MNLLSYNLAMALGLICISTGCAVLWGTGVALIVCGVCMIGITLISLKVAG